MLKICDLTEFVTEDEVDYFIEHRKVIPANRMHRHWYNINNVVEDDSEYGSFYLAEDDQCAWWFGPRRRGGIADRDDYKWFCFRTEDDKYHKFNISDIQHSRDAMNKILEWIARGSATDGPALNLTRDEVEFMDI